MNEQEMAVKLAEVDARSKSNTHRLDKIEKEFEALNKLATAMEVMANEQKHIAETITTMEDNLDTLKKEVTPMSKGGLTVLENLQLLCRKCNWVKSDHEDDLPLASREISNDFMPNVTLSGTQLFVKLGDLRKTFSITQARRERGYMTFQIGTGKYKYMIRNGNIIKIG